MAGNLNLTPQAPRFPGDGVGRAASSPHSSVLPVRGVAQIRGEGGGGGAGPRSANRMSAAVASSLLTEDTHAEAIPSAPRTERAGPCTTP